MSGRSGSRLPDEQSGPDGMRKLPSIPTIYIVDADSTLQQSLTADLACRDWSPAPFSSAEALLAEVGLREPGCVLMESRLPGMSGLSLQGELQQRSPGLPRIFLSSEAEIPTAVQAMRGGALDFLLKPVAVPELLALIETALGLNRAYREARDGRRQFLQRLVRLTAREGEVLTLALSGMANKEIAVQLGMSPRTVEGHRSRILLKTGVDSLLQLLHQAGCAGVELYRYFPNAATAWAAVLEEAARA
jgi:FixJ family two-component response regulator